MWFKNRGVYEKNNLPLENIKNNSLTKNKKGIIKKSKNFVFKKFDSKFLIRSKSFSRSISNSKSIPSNKKLKINNQKLNIYKLNISSKKNKSSQKLENINNITNISDISNRSVSNGKKQINESLPFRET